MKLWRLALVLLTLCVSVLDMVSGHGKLREKRMWIIDSFMIEEESPGPFPYPLGIINVEKSYLLRFTLTGQGVDRDPTGVLSIDQKTGQVLVHKKIDYELHQILKLAFEAINEDNLVDTRLGVEIKVIDINDNPPVFNSKLYETTLDESAAEGSSVITVRAEDKDNSKTPNGTFSFKITSIIPEPENHKFYITQTNDIGHISFTGCLDYEKAPQYKILIEAKDHGPKVQLSSTGTVLVKIMDKNNHRPEITGHTGPEKVKERASGVEVVRVQVSDKDSRGSPAWKAKFTLHGVEAHYFNIQTDPLTNEGILKVVKPIDYEDKTSINVSISVENEIPYFSCKVLSRSTGTSKWDVERTVEGPGTNPVIKLYPISIAVEDINDPPVFCPPVQIVLVTENTKPGTIIGMLKAEDPDKTFENSFKFFKGIDVDNWVTVNQSTGQVSVAKTLDRESPLVINNSYSVIMHVVDNAKPPLTGTGTLIIQIRDQNDNVPILVMNTVSMCLTANTSKTNITAVDLDLPPYSEPFKYELLGDVEGKWRLDPTHGVTVDLVRESSVYSGIYDLQIRVLDGQGMGMVQNLTVTVCSCLESPNCHTRRFVKAQPSLSAIGIMMFALLLLFAILLMAIWTRKDKPIIPDIQCVDSYIIASNQEVSGSDCKMPYKAVVGEMDHSFTKPPSHQEVINDHNVLFAQLPLNLNLHTKEVSSSSDQWLVRRSMRRSSSRRSYRQIRNYDMETNGKYSSYSYNEFHLRQLLKARLEQSLLHLSTGPSDLEDYEPHCYACEGEPESVNLDSISIPEMEINPDDLNNLDFRFNRLATVCRPALME